jgi:SPP1 gp7 family putative phage head morphogenesis protein
VIVERQLIRGAMLGAADSLVEREGEEPEPLAALASWRAGYGTILQKVGVDTKLTGLPFESAVKLFEERRILPKEHFDQLSAAAKRKAFTVAGLAQEELLQEAHGELARQIRESREKTFYDEATGKWVYKGPNLREFDKFAKTRLESAGWTPANPSHVETVFRTNIMGAYSSGRIVETTQPDVVAARPYWEIRGVNDSRQRKTHFKAQGTILSADNPFWRRAYPPFGYNCRCRVISRSKAWVDKHGGPTRVPDGLPDPGFESGIDASLVPNPLPAQSEGTRKPTAPAASHPINRPPPLPPIQKPVHVAPPPVSVLPKEPYRAPPPAPTALPLSTGIHAGTHASTVLADRRVAAKRIETVLSSYSSDELAWLKRAPLTTLQIRQTLVVGGRSANGCYNWATDALAVRAKRAKGTWGVPFVAGESWSVSATRSTADAATQATARHELGHRLHMRAPRHIDEQVSEAFKKANPITQYATQDHREYFAESYAMYRENPAALKAHDPEGFRIVRYVLDHWGIPHGPAVP